MELHTTNTNTINTGTMDTMMMMENTMGRRRAMSLQPCTFNTVETAIGNRSFNAMDDKTSNTMEDITKKSKENDSADLIEFTSHEI